MKIDIDKFKVYQFDRRKFRLRLNIHATLANNFIFVNFILDLFLDWFICFFTIENRATTAKRHLTIRMRF